MNGVIAFTFPKDTYILEKRNSVYAYNKTAPCGSTWVVFLTSESKLHRWRIISITVFQKSKALGISIVDVGILSTKSFIISRYACYLLSSLIRLGESLWRTPKDLKVDSKDDL